jgi:hypothetical protein
MKEGQNKNYISLQEATKFCSYSQKYLNLRVRQGKLRAVKIGRNWVTKKEWIDEYVKKYNGNGYHEWQAQEQKIVVNFEKDIKAKTMPSHFTLTAAVFTCLLIISFWQKDSITKTFVTADAFVQGFAENSFNILAQSESDFYKDSFRNISLVFSSIGFLAKDSVNGVATDILETKDFVVSSYKNITENISNNVSKTTTAIINSPSENIVKNKNIKKETSLNISKEIAATVGDYGKWLGQELSEKITPTQKAIFTTPQFITKNGQNFLGNIFEFLPEQAKNKITQITAGIKNWSNIATAFIKTFVDESIKNIVQFFNKQENQLVQERVMQADREGIVVAPSTTENEKTIQKIQKSFSDEVAVQMKDSNAGIIKPVFKTDTSQEYLYLLVPIQETN